jgi:hypothetical protein
LQVLNESAILWCIKTGEPITFKLPLIRQAANAAESGIEANNPAKLDESPPGRF